MVTKVVMVTVKWCFQRNNNRSATVSLVHPIEALVSENSLAYALGRGFNNKRTSSKFNASAISIISTAVSGKVCQG